MAAFKVLITDNLAPEGIAVLEREKDVELDIQVGIPHEALKTIIGQYDAIITRSGTTVTADLLENPGRLKIIGRAGVGLDNIDLEAASIKGVIVMNAPTGNTIAATELTMGMMLAAARKIPAANTSLKKEEWTRKKFMGRQLYGKTLGVVGLGRIGGSVAARAKAFGMKVIAFDPYIKKVKSEGLGVTLYDRLEDLLALSDVITIHTPKTEETQNMITAQEFSLMKDGVVVVNCARGGIINEDDLYEAVKSGKVFAAGVDVFGQEPLGHHKLLELENVFVTPHIGANTVEGQEGVAVIIAEQVINALRGRAYENAVNIPYMRSQLPAPMQLYFDLAEAMGRLAAQVAKGRPEAFQITMVGNKFKEDFGERVFDIPFSFQPFTVAGLKGFLEKHVKEAVSFINAPYLAKERDMDIQESKTSSYENYNDLLLLRIKTDEGEHLMGGTVFADNVCRILFLDQFHLEMVAQGNYLYFKNIDKPGIVGKVGTVLGKHQINIAGFNLSRVKGGKAVSFVSLDNEVPKEVIDELLEQDGLLEAKVVTL
ncbi:MAG: phosphoglycerate dehydrogenase [Deltaproteobacteria bacterium]|nr:phosphoglycerate dehydrogenase [Candidatus Anaeroferrophillus wilburensis]MBN2887801.1 phosphoglycerate dehydrogenase [Deltaproteobacteria bacterium]